MMPTRPEVRQNMPRGSVFASSAPAPIDIVPQ